MPIKIVSDTCHYLPRQLVEANQIHEVSLYVREGEATQRESDITDLGVYYERLRDMSGLPTTSQPSIGDFLETYRPLLDDGNEIVSIHLSGGISGTVRAAQQAREQLGEAAERVHVFDSSSACGGEGLILLAAAAVARAGAGVQDVLERARQARGHLKLWFAVDTLEYLRRGGRIAGAQAWLGSALKIKPILTVKQEITPVERVRTSKRAFDKMVELLRTCHDDGCDAWMVQHIRAPTVAEELAARGREIFGNDPCVVAEIGPVIGTHVGPGLLGAGGIPSALLA